MIMMGSREGKVPKELTAWWDRVVGDDPLSIREPSGYEIISGERSSALLKASAKISLVTVSWGVEATRDHKFKPFVLYACPRNKNGFDYEFSEVVSLDQFNQTASSWEVRENRFLDGSQNTASFLKNNTRSLTDCMSSLINRAVFLMTELPRSKVELSISTENHPAHGINISIPRVELVNVNEGMIFRFDMMSPEAHEITYLVENGREDYLSKKDKTLLRKSLGLPAFSNPIKKTYPKVARRRSL
jgi:hypothetical protein